ncbi:nicotinamide riboside transporter PnuC [Flavobacterium pallidum]|uniref:Nicotinamide riboside transporter PnuC n=1 Tax=Flavobacterium pallidum TaxID=2172098 RepID=A0A2S1SES6_9FLAO|nr:nicotinamide riboside transporter PnuC [Flavobacterium pallidum]AWI24857.1 nicotinamide mononucleotide transporter [Flavobacterium pallidum]
MTDFFLDYYKTIPAWQTALEFVVFVFGILSVWFAKKENIWVYPTGLIATIITSYLLYVAGYIGDMSVNIYFTVMSFYGWYNWAKSGDNKQNLPITRTNRKEKLTGILLFFITIFVVYALYKIFDQQINTDNYVDIFASGLFFTGMWYMAKKKIENWTLWIIGDIIVTPLYAYRGLGMLSLQYLIFTLLAISAYLEWKRILSNKLQQL